MSRFTIFLNVNAREWQFTFVTLDDLCWSLMFLVSYIKTVANFLNLQSVLSFIISHGLLGTLSLILKFICIY